MNDFTMSLSILALYIIVIFLGGIVAYRKGDLFSRGAAICSITWFFGLITMLIAPESKARAGDKTDLMDWYVHGSKGGIIFVVCTLLFLIIRLFLN